MSLACQLANLWKHADGKNDEKMVLQCGTMSQMSKENMYNEMDTFLKTIDTDALDRLKQSETVLVHLIKFHMFHGHFKEIYTLIRVSHI